jgi:hypothetical protein
VATDVYPASDAERVTVPDYSQCDQLLEEEIQRILREDKEGIIPMQFHLTVLKTAQKIMVDNAAAGSASLAQPNFDRYILGQMNRLKELHRQNPDIQTSIDRLYRQAGSAAEQQLVAHGERLIGPGQTKTSRFDNSDVTWLILNDRLEKGDNSSFSHQDLSILWFLSRLKERSGLTPGTAEANLLELRVQVNRYLGIAGDTVSVTPQAIQAEFAQTQQRMVQSMIRIRQEIRSNLGSCFNVEGLWKGSCQLPLEDKISQVLLDMEPVLNEASQRNIALIARGAMPPNRPPPPRVVSPSVARAAAVGGAGGGGARIHTASGGNAGGACGPQFRETTRGYRRIDFSQGDFRRARNALDSLSNLIAATGACSKDPVGLAGEFERSDVSKCCGGSIQWKRQLSVALGISGGFTCHLTGVGIPWLADAGAYIGLQLDGYGELQHSGRCNSPQTCPSVNFRAEPNGGVYGRLLGGYLAEVRGGVRWSPRLSLSQCFSAGGGDEGTSLKLRAGTVQLEFRASGLGFSYHAMRIVHQSNAEATLWQRAGSGVQ